MAFANDGGIGAQTRRLAQMLKPDRVMVIDSSGFSKNPQQHFEWYKDYNHFIVNGFPNNNDVKKFLPNLTHVFCVENPYNFGLVYWGQEQKTKIYCQSNYEFCDNLDKPWLPIPDKFLMPSYWKIEEMQKRYGYERVQYLPPPIDPKEFEEPRTVNMKRTGKVKFLHVIGTPAMQDRNGTFDLIDSIVKTKSDFELTIKCQHNLSMDVFLDDPRVKYEVGNAKDNNELYKDFDVLVLARRWGGLSLTMNEAMMSGMPVITTDISPQTEWLPRDWRVKSEHKGSFPARSMVDFYSADHQTLADKIDEFATMSREKLQEEKEFAFKLARASFSPEELKPQYLNLLDDRKS